MNESGPRFEQPKITEEQAIEDLRTYGADPEKAVQFMQWALEGQQTMDELIAAQGEAAAVLPIIQRGISIARVYFKAGLIEEAFDSIDSTVSALGKGPEFDEVTAEAVALHAQIVAAKGQQ
jgi:hypothetical protein